MQVELKRIQQEVGITFIYVTHDQEEAMTMSDRIAVMNKGRYEQLGDPESLYERPTHAVRRWLPGRQQPAARRRAGHRRRLRQRSSSATTRPSAPRARSVDGTGDVDIGVRPEKIRLREPAEDDPTPAGHNQLRGVVRDASYLGVSTQYQVEARGGARLTVYEQNVERATRAELWAAGRGGPADLVARPQLRRRGTRCRATSDGRTVGRAPATAATA